MNFATALFGPAPGTAGAKVQLALLRALRTFLQGVVAALGTGVAGSAILTTGYWETVGVAIVGAAITAIASFIQNVISILPADPTQKPIPTGN